MMRKGRIWGALLCSLCLAISTPITAMADSQKVITLGADLSQEQKDMMLRYFNVDTNTAQILYITNADERAHLSAFVPIEQIGTRTVSCAYVKPTSQGGIRVRTANLDWVTSNMIASTLSTSGVVNCEVVAASPFVVSGTGALTGIMMAYESASGETLDAAKKELATEELVVTGKLAENVGRNDATTIINEAKMKIIGENVQQAEEIQNIVVNIIQQNNLQVSDEQMSQIINLLEQIAQQNYNYEDVKETLERVDENVNGSPEDETFPEEEADEQLPEENPEEDNILNSVDESALGENIISDSTEEPAAEDEAQENQESFDEQWDWIDESTQDETVMNETIPDEGTYDEGTYDENNQDSYMDDNMEDWMPVDEGQGVDLNEELPMDDGTGDVQTETTPDMLDEASRAQYEKAVSFCAGVYGGDTASIDALVAAGDMDALEVTLPVLNSETADSLTEKVLEIYLEILTSDTSSYIPEDGDLYFSSEMNLLARELKPVFGVEEENTDGAESQELLTAFTSEEKETLYQETMKFFGKIYGEDASWDHTDETGYDETGYDETGYDETGYDETGYDETGYDETGYDETAAY